LSMAWSPAGGTSVSLGCSLTPDASAHKVLGVIGGEGGAIGSKQLGDIWPLSQERGGRCVQEQRGGFLKAWWPSVGSRVVTWLLFCRRESGGVPGVFCVVSPVVGMRMARGMVYVASVVKLTLGGSRCDPAASLDVGGEHFCALLFICELFCLALVPRCAWESSTWWWFEFKGPPRSLCSVLICILHRLGHRLNCSSPVFQFIAGFCIFNQVSPSMALIFPRPITLKVTRSV
jgi:hypothetical protein